MDTALPPLVQFVSQPTFSPSGVMTAVGVFNVTGFTVTAFHVYSPPCADVVEPSPHDAVHARAENWTSVRS